MNARCTDPDADLDDELTQRLFALTWQALLADHGAFAGAAGGVALGPRPRRFFTRDAVERTRAAIEHTCALHGADDDFVAYMTTRWLDRFAPRPV